jgi:transposase
VELAHALHNHCRIASATADYLAASLSSERTIRRLLILGASAVIRQACLRGAPAGSWLAQMLPRKPKMLVTVALANKMARVVWALLIKGGVYKAPAAAA